VVGLGTFQYLSRLSQAEPPTGEDDAAAKH